MSRLPELIRRAIDYSNRRAIISGGSSHTYRELLDGSAAIANTLCDRQGDLTESRVGFLIPPGYDYAATQWAIWRAGGVTVPLALSHPARELNYVIRDAGVSLLVAGGEQERARLTEATVDEDIDILSVRECLEGRHTDDSLPDVDDDRRAMILYTSGTTSQPKGVVTTHGNIRAQVTALTEAWEWQSADHILHILPLHHIHGIVNVLSCALWAGATCEFLPRFDVDQVCQRFSDGDLTLFMAVPTIYAKLIHTWEQSPQSAQDAISAGLRNMRLMVSGSAALPVSTLERWHEISGHVLLERYGMTEIGMALSNPLRGERVPGSVGRPLPRVEVRRVDEGRRVITDDQTPGEIETRGPAVFGEYWGKPEATTNAFRDGWFATGDVAVEQNGVFRILGRNSVYIIKTGGYKVSALEIEEILRTHPAIQECAVVGIDDDEWGERVAACVVIQEGLPLDLASLRSWAKEYLAPYKVPSELMTVGKLPRNSMGKVQKPAICKLFTDEHGE